MKINIILYISIIFNLSYSMGFSFSRLHYLMPSNSINKSNLFSNRLYYKRERTNKIYARYLNDISRRTILYLSPFVLKPNIVFSEDNLNIKNVAVFGATGYTGGDTIRNLLNRNINVKAFVRRPVDIVNRENAKKNSLVIDNIEDKNKLNIVISDILKKETIENKLNDVDAVIFCAASKPKVTVKPTPGVNLNQKNIVNNDFVEMSEHVEDIGLINVAKEAIKNNVKKLIIVSSICAKCQKNDIEHNIGEAIDRGETSCTACYNKQEGEERVKLLYENAPSELSYSIIRPGMLSPGEKRGVEEIEFNQGVSKSGIISRMDLADILVEASLSNNTNKKTFEVYYRDTAQPVDMYKSLKTCKDMGKSVKECFFGEGYDNDEQLSIDKLIKNKQKGSIFLSGREVIGNNYNDMFKKLDIDKKETYDLNILKSTDIM